MWGKHDPSCVTICVLKDQKDIVTVQTLFFAGGGLRCGLCCLLGWPDFYPFSAVNLYHCE